jgi:hypothetical protein
MSGVPVLALPNLDMRGAIECEHAAIVSPVDPRVEQLRSNHPNLTTTFQNSEASSGSRSGPLSCFCMQMRRHPPQKR